MTIRRNNVHDGSPSTPARLVALVAAFLVVFPVPPAGSDVAPSPEPAEPTDVTHLNPAEAVNSPDSTLDPIVGEPTPATDGTSTTTTTTPDGSSPPSASAVLPEPSPSPPADGAQSPSTTADAGPPQAAPNPPAAAPDPDPAPAAPAPPADGAQSAPTTAAPDPPPALTPRRTTVAGTRFPAQLQAMTDSVVRSGSRSTAALVDAVDVLEASGTDRQDAVRLVFGRFPVAGLASYSHDWWFPRFGPVWRLHQGTDIFAAHGTPVLTPVDGIVSIRNGALGGLSVRVTEADGTFWYLAHLSAVPTGLAAGSSVRVGDVVGYVGNSGNARATPPHLHLEIHPRGGSAVDPKATLDQLLSEAAAALPAVLSAPVTDTATPPAPHAGRWRVAAPLLSPVAPVASAVAGPAVHGETAGRRGGPGSRPVLGFARPIAFAAGGDGGRRSKVMPVRTAQGTPAEKRVLMSGVTRRGRGLTHQPVRHLRRR